MVRFTDVEYALVSFSAEQAGYPVAVYVRKQAITEKLHVHYNIVADIAELRDFARQLSHIGNNLNQIAAFFNSGGIQSRAMLEPDSQNPRFCAYRGNGERNPHQDCQERKITKVSFELP